MLGLLEKMVRDYCIVCGVRNGPVKVRLFDSVLSLVSFMLIISVLTTSQIILRIRWCKNWAIQLRCHSSAGAVMHTHFFSMLVKWTQESQNTAWKSQVLLCIYEEFRSRITMKLPRTWGFSCWFEKYCALLICVRRQQFIVCSDMNSRCLLFVLLVVLRESFVCNF